MHIRRGERRLEASMKQDTTVSVWYDNGACNVSFEKAVEAIERKTRHNFSNTTQCRNQALLKCATGLNNEFHVSVRDLFSVYKSEYQLEMLNALIPCTWSDCEKESVLNGSQNDCLPLEKLSYLRSRIIPNIPDLKYKSSDFRDLICNHFPVIVLYSCETNITVPYFVKKIPGIDWNVITSMQWPKLKTNDKQELNEIACYALKTCKSEKDRAVLKCVLSKVLSVKELVDMKIVSSKYSLRTAEKATLRGMINNSTPEPRASGAGRPAIESQYQDLVALLIQLFDGTGEGLRSHPRLITDILFLENKSFMNMSRCVSILQQCYGIKISVSTAYSFTSNAREGSYQSRRHKKIATPISLKKSTRDVVKNPSINSHYASANMQYLYKRCFEMEEVAVIARDNKARVHCDVEVVDRPSKSWKRVRYSDHHFDKDSKRSITITTYQLVKENTNDSHILTTLGSIPVTRTRVTGKGICIVKASYFELESVFRHLNEFLIVMLRSPNHFLSSSGTLKPTIVITVDGGGDERPRNKTTKFCCTLLRWVLNRDRIVQISYAEHDSKLHSVERVHTAENYALSQLGEISSRQKHPHETGTSGFFDISKMRENMNCAVNDVVVRLKGTPFASEPIDAFSTLPTSQWVFDPEYEQNIREFLRTDSLSHRRMHNFIIKPSGPTWEALKSLFNLADPGEIHARDIVHHMTDERFTYCQHYGFTVYRQDENWLGAYRCRYEIQPVPDISCLPDFHYRSYSQVMEDVQVQSASNMKPSWLSPDFYLPSLNIENILAAKECDRLDDDDIHELSTLVIVPENDIRKCIDERNRKKEENVQNKKTKDQYKDTALGSRKREELIQILKHFKVKLLNRYYKKGELLKMVDDEIQKREVDVDSVISTVFKRK